LLLEQNPDLCAFARANTSRVRAGVRVVESDARSFDMEPTVDLAITNPPFFPVGSGRESDNPMVRDATHTHRGDLRTFLALADRLLAPDGHVVVLYPAEALADALVALAEFGLAPGALAFVYARHTADPFRAWIRADRFGASLDGPIRLSPAALRR
jgi:tRNA1(Val) A37 N6-methylase TrmN6